LVLKITRNTRPLFHVQVIIQCGVSLASVAVLSALYGVNGAATALIVTGVANVLLLKWFQLVVSRSQRAERPSDVVEPSRETAALGLVAAEL
jgi:hypothetical protein